MPPYLIAVAIATIAAARQQAYLALGQLTWICPKLSVQGDILHSV